MQKKLIALAVAGLVAAPAFAQVTMYGVVDAGYVNRKVDNPGATADNKFSQISSGLLSGSRLGFNAEEDLGGGMKAVGKIEAGINLDDGTNGQSAVWGRQSYVGLAGGFGEVRLGRQYSAASAALLGFDSMAATTYSAMANDLLVAGDFNSGGTRDNNAVGYNAPMLGPVKASLTYALGEQDTGTSGSTSSNKLSLAATAAFGPATAGVFYTANSGSKTATTSATDVDEMGFGGTFDLGMAKLFLTYANYESDKPNNPGSTTTAANTEGSAVTLGAIVKVGAGNLHVQYQKADGETKDSTSGTMTKIGEADGTRFSFAYLHALGKRTTAHVGYYSRTNEVKTIATGATAETKISAVAAGLRLTF